MKLRIKGNVGNSIRLRILRSELTELMTTGRIAETVRFGANDESVLTYALEVQSGLTALEVRHEPREIRILLPLQQATSWAETDRVGIYETVSLGAEGALEIIVEKDFACLDQSDADNHDTFENPQVGEVC